MKILSFGIGVATSISVVLNISLIILLVKKRKKTPMAVILLSLALADVIHCSIGFSVEIYIFITDCDNKSLCNFSGFTVIFFSIVAIWHLVLLSLDRFLSLKSTSEQLQCSRKKRLSIALILTWINGLIWAMFPLLGWNSYTHEDNFMVKCNLNFRDRTINGLSYLYSLLIFCHIIPLTLIAISHYQMKKILNNMSIFALKLVGIRSRMFKDSIKEEKFHIRLVVKIVFGFVFSWTPYALLVIMISVQPESVDTLMLDIAALLAKLSTVLNPLIYAYSMGFFKRCIKRLKKMHKPHRV